MKGIFTKKGGVTKDECGKNEVKPHETTNTKSKNTTSKLST